MSCWQTMMLVLEVPGWEAGVKHGGRVNTGVSPSYVSQPQYADLPYTPAASTTGPPALFRRCQIFFLNADCSQTVSSASKVGTYVTEIVKCRPNPATGRKYQTKQTKNKQGSANIGRPYCLHYKTTVLPVYCYDPKCHYWTMIV